MSCSPFGNRFSATESCFISAKPSEEIEQHRLEKVPIFRAAGEEGTEREFIAARLVYVNTRQITPAGLLNFDLGHLLLGDCGTGGAGLLGELVEEDLIT